MINRITIHSGGNILSQYSGEWLYNSIERDDTGKKELLYYSTKAFDFTLNCQTKNGLWDYSVDLVSGQRNRLVDWHQGFILDSLCEYLTNNPDSPEYFFSSMKNYIIKACHSA